MTQAVYKIVDEQGKLYIGSSSNIERRWKEHIRELDGNKHDNPKLQNAWNKHGAEYFTFSVIEIVDDRTKLLSQEQKYLNLLFAYYSDKQHYNIMRKAGSRLGQIVSEETKAKIAIKQRGNKHSLGVIRSEETKLKMSLAKKGKLHSEEHKAKISQALLNRKQGRLI